MPKRVAVGASEAAKNVATGSDGPGPLSRPPGAGVGPVGTGSDGLEPLSRPPGAGVGPVGTGVGTGSDGLGPLSSPGAGVGPVGTGVGTGSDGLGPLSRPPGAGVGPVGTGVGSGVGTGLGPDGVTDRGLMEPTEEEVARLRNRTQIPHEGEAYCPNPNLRDLPKEFKTRVQVIQRYPEMR